jgi:hypothetical protein
VLGRKFVLKGTVPEIPPPQASNYKTKSCILDAKTCHHVHLLGRPLSFRNIIKLFVVKCFKLPLIISLTEVLVCGDDFNINGGYEK